MYLIMNLLKNLKNNKITDPLCLFIFCCNVLFSSKSVLYITMQLRSYYSLGISNSSKWSESFCLKCFLEKVYILNLLQEKK